MIMTAGTSSEINESCMSIRLFDVVDTKRYVPYESSSNAYDEALNEAAATIEADSSEGQLLVSCKYFECYKHDISDSVSINVDTASFAL